MCKHFNLITRLCACGENALPQIPKGTISTIIPNSNGFEVGDKVKLKYSYGTIKKVTDSGTSWFYYIDSGICVSESELRQDGNEPTRTFYWGYPSKTRYWDENDEDIKTHLVALKKIFEGPGFKLQECTIPVEDCPWKKEHELYNAVIKLYDTIIF